MSESTLWIGLTVLGTVGTLALGIALKKLVGRIRAGYKDFHAPQLSFRYDAHDVCAMVEILKEKGLSKAFDRFSLMMAAMMAEVLVVLMVVVHNITEIAWLQYGMFALSGVIWLAGTLETLIVKKRPGTAGMIAFLKWGAFAVWTLGMFAALFIRSAAY